MLSQARYKQKPVAEYWDIIGDIHGEAIKLEALLLKMGYENTADEKHPIYRHPKRRACFLGDYIDRGDHILRTLTIVKNMCDEAGAKAILGNHEFNYLAFHATQKNIVSNSKKPLTMPVTKNTEQNYIRPHTPKNSFEIKKTVAEFEALNLNLAQKDTRKTFEDWFYSLPFYLELDAFRLVHACWHKDSLAILQNSSYLKNKAGRISPEFLSCLHVLPKEKSALEKIIKGPSFSLPDELSFQDNQKITRKNIRTKWWENPLAILEYTSSTVGWKQGASQAMPSLDNILKDYFFLPQKEKDLFISKFKKTLSPELFFSIKHKFHGYDSSEKPLFIGHYWLRLEDDPSLLKNNLACLDYSAAHAHGGHLCAYRYSGEKTLDIKNFVWV